MKTTSVSIKNQGFSLVEVLVALSILLLVLVGPMTIIAGIGRSADFATEQVEATFLAQEGAELVEKIRNDYFLGYFQGTNPNPWSQFTNSNGYLVNCYGASGCGLEWLNNENLRAPINCGAGTGCRLFLNSDANARARYTHQPLTGISGNTQTPFTRTIRLTPIPAVSPNAVRVNSTVTWRTGTLIADQRVEVVTYLYNIYAAP